MGVADLPRIVFSGLAYWNPSTMNNNDYQPTYDPASATLDWPFMERHGLRNEQDFDRYATRSAGVVPTANDPLNQVQPQYPPALWNFYGDNTCGFLQPDVPTIEWPEKFAKPSGSTIVTAFVDSTGKRVTSGDPWIGQPVILNLLRDEAKLVDVDPIAPWSSQLFAESIAIGGADAAVGFNGGTAGRAHSRWVWFGRNLNLAAEQLIIAGPAQAIWQFGLPTDELEFREDTVTPGSLAAQLRAALQRPGVRGLMARFVTYRTVYFQGDAFKPPGQPHWDVITGLYDEYARKQALYEEGKLEEPPPRPVNRAYSNVVGWIGPWSGDDMRTGPVGRILHGEQSVVPVGSTQKVALGLAALEYTTEPADPSRIARVAVDLGSAIPERNPALEKVDVGTLAFASAAGGQPTVFARVPYPAYAKDAYEQGGGVVEFAAGELLAPLTAEDLQAPIVVLCEQPAGLVQQGFAEAEYTAETDDRGVYLDEPGTTSDAATMTVQVRYRGGSPPIGTQLQVEQYTPTTPGFNEDTWGLVSSGDPHAQSPYLTMSAGGAAVVDGAYLTVALVREPAGPDSWPVTVSLGSIRPGPAILRFRVFAPADPVLPPPPSDVQWPNLPYQSFANARVLPFHNTMAEAFENWLRAGPSVDLVTQRVFDAVFRTFFLMYPAMRFLRDPLQFQAWRGRILAATDPGAFETAAYMPVTRSLSAGQRRILELWDTYLDGTLPTPRHSGEPLGRRS